MLAGTEQVVVFMSDDQAGDDIKLAELLARIPMRECLLVLAVVVFVAARLEWFFTVPGHDRASGYFAVRALRGVDLGQTVYRDFSFEYPPLAWWLTAMPRWIDSRTYSDTSAAPEEVARFRDWYFGWFNFELFAADVVCFLLLFFIGGTISPTARWALPTAYAVMTAVQPWFLYETLDIGLAMFFLLAIAAWLKAQSDSSPLGLWGIAAYVFLGLGISFKIMPVVFVPFLLLADWRAGLGWGQLATRVAVLTAAAAGPFLLHYALAGPGVFELFRYHGERGINIESTWGAIVLVLRWFGFPCEVVESHWAFDVVSPVTDAFKTLSSVLPPAMLAAAIVWAWRQGTGFSRRLAMDTAILVLVNAAVLSHVYCLYYAFWLMPLALLLAWNTFSRSDLVWGAFALLVIVQLAISSWLYPWHYQFGLISLEPVPVALSVIRGACLAGMAALLDWQFFAAYRRHRPATSAWPSGATATAISSAEG
ncbi:MAG TPA: hypothetical protein VMF30_10965 [Pirellulales bacterium]|nr:hypothetical protein [Pirellulales bacterium]